MKQVEAKHQTLEKWHAEPHGCDLQLPLYVPVRLVVRLVVLLPITPGESADRREVNTLTAGGSVACMPTRRQHEVRTGQTKAEGG